MQIFQLHINDTLSEVVKDVINPWACYILFQNKPIARLGKTDTNGILYIGKADNLYNRVASLQQSVLANYNNSDKAKIKGHQSLSKKVFRIQRYLDTSKMTIKIIVLPSYESILYTESYLIEEYVSQFGELPPLNGQYGIFERIEAQQYLVKNNIKLENFIN
ncbi:MAG: GIY-YIG nuclease family protein [Flavobacteriaceae bacterium]|nr:GIY-YIG nuclease family protein [Flavobacteriaceae bacterium]